MTWKNFKLQYIVEEERIPYNQNKPTWENQINEILNYFSNCLQSIEDAAPYYAKYMANWDWAPFWIAVYDTSEHFCLPQTEGYEPTNTEFEINTETLEIRLME